MVSIRNTSLISVMEKQNRRAWPHEWALVDPRVQAAYQQAVRGGCGLEQTAVRNPQRGMCGPRSTTRTRVIAAISEQARLAAMAGSRRASCLAIRRRASATARPTRIRVQPTTPFAGAGAGRVVDLLNACATRQRGR